MCFDLRGLKMSQESARIMERVTLFGVVLTMFIQVSAGVWWASRITTVQDMHTLWIADHKIASKNYPVLEQRIITLEDAIKQTCVKLERLSDNVINHEKKG